MPRRYSREFVTVSVDIKNGFFKLQTSLNDVSADLGNEVLKETARLIKTYGVERKTPYPPSVNRVPGHTKRSVQVVECFVRANGSVAVGNINIDTWLFDWLRKVNTKTGRMSHSERSAFYRASKEKVTARKLDVAKGRKIVTKGTGRFRYMLPADPRRIIGEPLEKTLSLLRSKNRLAKELQKSINEVNV